jgi:hypothetical protein
MKTQATEKQDSADPEMQRPMLSFSHLCFPFYGDDEGDTLSGTAYGYPAAREENLHETGCLARIFLKC